MPVRLAVTLGEAEYVDAERDHDQADGDHAEHRRGRSPKPWLADRRVTEAGNQHLAVRCRFDVLDFDAFAVGRRTPADPKPRPLSLPSHPPHHFVHQLAAHVQVLHGQELVVAVETAPLFGR